MNHIHFSQFKDFPQPVHENWFSCQFVLNLANNILTLGIDAATRSLGYQTRIYELEKEQAFLLRRYASIKDNWRLIEQRLEQMIEDVLDWQSEVENNQEQEGGLEEWQERIEQFSHEEIGNNLIEMEECPLQYTVRKVFIVFSALSQLFADLYSFGFHGCYQNVMLKNRIATLEMQNEYIEKEISELQGEYQGFFQKNIDLLQREIECNHDLASIYHTDQAKAYFKVSDLSQKMLKLKKDQETAEKQFKTLQSQYKVAKEAEGKLAVLQQSFDVMVLEKQEMTKKIHKLEMDKKNLESLQGQNKIKEQSQKGSLSEQDLKKLQTRLGPLPVKYHPKKAELEELEEGKGSDPTFITAFKHRYEGLSIAAEVFKRGFAYALKEIYQMASQGKIQLNRSLGTPTSKAGQVAYRFLALDWIKGGKLASSCHGYELILNGNGVKLVPSHAENVLRYQNVDGRLQPVITVHFGTRCDLIPGEEILKHTAAACGIDPVAAKCLWAKMNQNDQRHFLNWMLEPAMEDTCLDYVAAVAYIRQLSSARLQEWTILRDLISDIAIALEAKFKHEIAMNEWKKFLDMKNMELQPFEKAEPCIFSQDNSHSETELELEPLIPWQLNFDILSATGKKDNLPTQVEFYALLLNAQEYYQVYFEVLKAGILLNPMTKGKKVQNITWAQLKHQFHICHQLIATHGCLLSNFLATIMTSRTHLTRENVTKLKIAMAAYLDDPHHAKEFEGALKNDFHCSVEKFKDWLRGKNKFLHNTDLTPTVLEIAAYTCGVRVALFSPPSGSQDFARTKGKVDEFGRLVPFEEIAGHYYGPPTEELFFMAVEDNYSYYGLFPKMKIKGGTAKKFGIEEGAWKTLQEIDAYWHEIQTSI